MDEEWDRICRCIKMCECQEMQGHKLFSLHSFKYQTGYLIVREIQLAMYLTQIWLLKRRGLSRITPSAPDMLFANVVDHFHIHKPSFRWVQIRVLP